METTQGATKQAEIQQNIVIDSIPPLEAVKKSEKREAEREEKSSIEARIRLPQPSIFSDKSGVDQALRVANMLSQSDMVPKSYQGKVQNIMIALEISQRLPISPFMVMQNLHVIQGRPAWSSSFIIAVINSSKRFGTLKFEMSGEGNDYGCTATAVEISTGEKLKGVKVTLKMAKDEGWYTRSGSKWGNMPEQMLKYRAAAFFGRIYIPEILMGMHTVDEVKDMNALATKNVEIKEQAALKAQEGYKIVKPV